MEMKTGSNVHCSTALEFRREVGKKATPKVKHHKFFAQRHVEVQFIPPPLCTKSYGQALIGIARQSGVRVLPDRPPNLAHFRPRLQKPNITTTTTIRVIQILEFLEA